MIKYRVVSIDVVTAGMWRLLQRTCRYSLWSAIHSCQMFTRLVVRTTHRLLYCRFNTDTCLFASKQWSLSFFDSDSLSSGAIVSNFQCLLALVRMSENADLTPRTLTFRGILGGKWKFWTQIGVGGALAVPYDVQWRVELKFPARISGIFFPNFQTY